MFARYLKRGQYLSHDSNDASKYKMPPELYYLAMVESGFKVNALSRKKARGVWQFIKGTAQRYHLRIDRQVDERLDPIRATIAQSSI